jgi:DNA-binding LacI/PurR family transcriptional regulator
MTSIRRFAGDKLKEDISSQIKSGQLKPGDAVLSGPQLSKKYKISKMSVEKTIRQMVDENILYRISGRGTFVKESSSSLSIGIVANPKEKNIFTSHYHSHLYQGIERGINEENGILLYQKKDRKSFQQMFKNTQMVDGMIIINPERKLENELLELAKNKKPFIVIGNSFAAPDINFIDSDNLEDTAKGVEHLIKSGHKRIVFVSSIKETLTSQKRLNGYLRPNPDSLA